MASFSFHHAQKLNLALKAKMIIEQNCIGGKCW